MVNKFIKGTILFASIIGSNSVYSKCCGDTSPEDALSAYLINNGVSKETASKDNSKILVDFAKNMCLLIDAAKEKKDNSKMENSIKAIIESYDKNDIIKNLFYALLDFVTPDDLLAQSLTNHGYEVTKPVAPSLTEI